MDPIKADINSQLMNAILKRKTQIDINGEPIEKSSPKKQIEEKIRAPSIMSNKNGPDNQQESDVPLEALESFMVHDDS